MVTEKFLIFRKTLLVQFRNKESGKQKCKYYVPVCLKKVLCLFSVRVCVCSVIALLSFMITHSWDVFALPQGCSDVPGFLQAVFGLLLPLGYEYDPSLVLLVRMPGSELCESMWQQLTGLLQGLAQGHTLILMQVRRLGQF